MTTRKIVLLAIFFALLAVCIVQGVLGSINPVKIIKTDATPDTITISTATEQTVLSLNNGSWFIGDDNYVATKTDVDSMIKAIKEIKVLDKVGRVGSAQDEKYNLTDEKARTVTAVKAGKEIAVIRIGKTTSTNAQTYACVNGKNDIYLLSGNLVSTFSKSAAELRSKTIYTVEENDFVSAQVTKGSRTWGIEKNPNDKNSWILTGAAPEMQLDQELARSWVQSICFMNINSWIDDGTPLPANKLTSFQMQIKSGATIVVDIYEQPAGDDTKYIGTCNLTPHKFDLTKYLTEKFAKDCTELQTK